MTRSISGIAGGWNCAQTVGMEMLDESRIALVFERLAAANPHPATELKSVNTFTLLVAVVLSAQMTDKGVNRATEPLFAVADTRKRWSPSGKPTAELHQFDQLLSGKSKVCYRAQPHIDREIRQQGAWNPRGVGKPAGRRAENRERYPECLVRTGYNAG